MKINFEVIKNIKRNQQQYKGINLESDKILKKEFFTSFKKYEEKLKKEDVYTAALWIDSNEKQLNSVRKNNVIDYQIGEILLVDLGWNNYDREFAYIHPAVVIKSTFEKIFIIPCTSGEPRRDKLGNVYPEFMVGKNEDGFAKASVLMLYEAKYIDKNRVISKLGKVTNEFYDIVYNKLFEQLFESKYYEIKKLKEQN